MNDKELAEKVAERLGELSKGWLEIIGEEDFFSYWPMFGLMVEDAERRGWQLYISDWDVMFLRAQEPDLMKKTKAHDVWIDDDTFDYIRACALAFLETFK